MPDGFQVGARSVHGLGISSADPEDGAPARGTSGRGPSPHGRFPSVTGTTTRPSLRRSVSRTAWPGFRERSA